MWKWIKQNWWWFLPLVVLVVYLAIPPIKKWWNDRKAKKDEQNKPPVGDSRYTNVDSQQNPLLQKGSYGNKVKELQQKLISKGHSLAPDGADMKFWSITEAALIKQTGSPTIYYNNVKSL